MSLKEELAAERDKRAVEQHLKEQQAQAKENPNLDLHVPAREVVNAQGHQQFATAAGQLAGYAVPQTYKPWAKDDDEQLIVYMRSAESMTELMTHYPDREKHEVWQRLHHIVHERREFGELKKALK